MLGVFSVTIKKVYPKALGLLGLVSGSLAIPLPLAKFKKLPQPFIILRLPSLIPLVLTTTEDFAWIERWGVGVVTIRRGVRITWVSSTSNITTCWYNSTSVSSVTFGISTSGRPRPIIPTKP